MENEIEKIQATIKKIMKELSRLDSKKGMLEDELEAYAERMNELFTELHDGLRRLDALKEANK